MNTKTAEIAVPNSIGPGPGKPNLLSAALANDDGDAAVTAIRGALGIESDDVASYSLPKHWPDDREQRARCLADWLADELRFLVDLQ
jgi:hypothetical protein